MLKRTSIKNVINLKLSVNKKSLEKSKLFLFGGTGGNKIWIIHI
jgi:hypothetical protein